MRGTTAARIPKLTLAVLLVLLPAACREEAEAVPTASEVESYYTYRGDLDASVEGGTVELRAYLPRNAMTGLMWPEALNIAARARTEGTERPARLEELVRYGEDHMDHEYAEEYQRQP